MPSLRPLLLWTLLWPGPWLHLATPAIGAGFPILWGDFFGQPPPGLTPALFAPGVVCTGMYERDVAVSADGRCFFFASTRGAAEELPPPEQRTVGYYLSRHSEPQNGSGDTYWVEAEVLTRLRPGR